MEPTETRHVTLGMDENSCTLDIHFNDDGRTSSGDLYFGQVRQDIARPGSPRGRTSLLIQIISAAVSAHPSAMAERSAAYFMSCLSGPAADLGHDQEQQPAHQDKAEYDGKDA
jgi:hypothetical protein